MQARRPVAPRGGAGRFGRVGKRGKFKKELFAEETNRRTALETEYFTEADELFAQWETETANLKDSLIVKYRRMLLEAQEASRSRERVLASDLQKLQVAFEEVRQLRLTADAASVVPEEPQTQQSMSEDELSFYGIAQQLGAEANRMRKEFDTRKRETLELQRRVQELEFAVRVTKEERANSEGKLRNILVEEAPQRDASAEIVYALEAEVKRRFDANIQEMVSALDSLLHDSAEVCHSHRKYNILTAKDEVKQDFVSRIQNAVVEQSSLLQSMRDALSKIQLTKFMSVSRNAEDAAVDRAMVSDETLNTLDASTEKGELMLLLRRLSFYPPVATFLSTIARSMNSSAPDDKLFLAQLGLVAQVCEESNLSDSSAPNPKALMIPSSATIPSPKYPLYPVTTADRYSLSSSRFRQREFSVQQEAQRRAAAAMERRTIHDYTTGSGNLVQQKAPRTASRTPLTPHTVESVLLSHQYRSLLSQLE